ncbi:MAG: YcjX family protein [Rhizobiales bacterium]|nr:YcjX family protein [Hyphomicrobiales bacterium]
MERAELLKNDIATPTIRLGVTGLSRAGKTVFITALLHNLIEGGRLALFDAHARGRIASAALQPQPNDDVPTFDYRAHVKDLVMQRKWPQSTRQISEIRLTLSFESQSLLSRIFKASQLHLDIVDYPGEWLLDLTLLDKTYRQWSDSAMALAAKDNRKKLARNWHKFIKAMDGDPDDLEALAQKGSDAFKTYLKACQGDEHALSMLPPGRFLMPGEMDGSPALTFCPLPEQTQEQAPQFHALMEKRYEAYKTHVVMPFFKNHFAKLDRQIVLVDVLNVLNAGPDAIHDLEATLEDVLRAFKPGKNSWLASILGKKIDRMVFAATKADHLHHSDHDRLEAILDHLIKGAAKRAKFSGAKTQTLAISAVRATREAHILVDGETVPAILGTPLAGEDANGIVYDGTKEIALFPGDLPDDPAQIYQQTPSEAEDPLRYLRFRPPKLETTAEGNTLSLPHIRLDRALQFLLGDKLA